MFINPTPKPMNSIYKFIVIDDDPVNNLICHEFIKITMSAPYFFLDFTSPEKGLAYITNERRLHADNHTTIILLDLNMPGMSGWQFMEKFNALKEEIRNSFSVYIVSSSINPNDVERAANHPGIKGYIPKPVTEEFLLQITNEPDARQKSIAG